MGRPAELPLEVPADAVWIGSEHPFDLHEAYLNFRAPRFFVPDERPLMLFITADSRYRLWVNGRLAGRGPARSWPSAQNVDEYDLAGFADDRSFAIAVQVYQPGYSHFSYVHRGMAGLLAWMMAGGEPVLVSGQSWRVQRDRSFQEHVSRVSIYGSGVEERDMRPVEPWQEPEYDAAGWPTARIVARPFDPPWTGLQRRQVPFSAEEAIQLKLVETRQGFDQSGEFDAHDCLRHAWTSAHPASHLNLSAEGRISPRLAAGETALWLFDLGRDYTVQGVVEVDNAAGTETVAISYAEKMRAGEIVLPDPATYCRVRLTDRFHLRSGSQTCRTFAMRGGRYLVFQLTGPTGDGFSMAFRARATVYPLPNTKPLGAIDPLLKQIGEMCENTILACLQDGFVDCVWRESSQWLGDAVPQSYTLLAMSDDVRPLRQILKQAAEGAYPDGVFPSVVPAEVHAYTIITYSLMWVDLLNLYFETTGDQDLILELWPALVKMLDGVLENQDSQGLVISPPGRRFYIDWAPLSQNQPHAVFNFHVLQSLHFAIVLAREIGRFEDEDGWAIQWENLSGAITRSFYANGCWYDDLERTTSSQLTAAMAILTGTAPPESWPSLCDEIAGRSLDPRNEPLDGEMVLASPFMHHYLFEALRRAGREADVVDIIRLRWGRWVKAGYPTTWENWNVDFPDGSQCHAFSAHPRYHLAEIGKSRPGLIK